VTEGRGGPISKVIEGKKGRSKGKEGRQKGIAPGVPTFQKLLLPMLVIIIIIKKGMRDLILNQYMQQYIQTVYHVMHEHASTSNSTQNRPFQI